MGQVSPGDPEIQQLHNPFPKALICRVLRLRWLRVTPLMPGTEKTSLHRGPLGILFALVDFKAAGFLFPFQGVAEAELEEDLARTFKTMMRSIKKEVGLDMWLHREGSGGNFNFMGSKDRGSCPGFPETSPSGCISRWPSL